MPVWEFKGRKAKIDPTAFIAPNATVIGDVEIGGGSSLWPSAVVRGDYNPVRIGRRVNIQDNATVHATPAGPCTIGDSVSVGHNAVVHRCTVGNNVIIGMGAIVLDGSKIGDWVIVGAGAVVTPNSEIPPKSMVLGIPAKVVGKLREGHLDQIRMNADGYADLAQMYRAQAAKLK
ncbi:MAG: gamma carbonic anhydrase family protein [Candidatus Bathyarchaeia archaeon]